MNKTAKDLIYLLSCAVNGITPDTARVQAMDLEQLYRLANTHMVSAAVYIALKSAGVDDHSFQQAYNKSVRRNVMLDVERTAIFERFEQQGIRYMPLKGSILKDLYPENGMREMSDNDVLYDSSKQAEVGEIMLDMGYTADCVGVIHHDTYFKPPVLNFELHTDLTGDNFRNLYNYYKAPQRLMIHDEDSKYGYHFSDEDFYVFMTAHEWKHYNGCGTGIRSLLDCYVYCKFKGDTLDWEHISEQCKQLEIADFEQERRALALKIFSSGKFPVLAENEKKMLMYYLKAGTYGTFENGIRNSLKEKDRLSFWLHRIFISRKQMAVSVPFTKASPLLYPVGFVWRSIRILLFRRDRVKQTVRVVKKYGK